MEMKLCDECGGNPATIHLTQIIQNELTVQHLCEACARKKGISVVIEDVAPESDIMVKPVEKAGEPSAPEKNITCPICGLTFAEFKEKGWLGCSSCYKAFDREIDELFIQVHGSTIHKGKQYHQPIDGLQGIDDLVILRKELDNAVRSEKFELAAMIRDKIHHVSAEVPSSKERG